MNLKTVTVGKDDFAKLINEGCYYVDKTIAIEELLSKNSEVVLYPRPRRFGKSLFISMLENFFDIDKRNENEHLFDGLAIQKSEYYKEFGEYPVITLDFKDLKKDDFVLTYREFQNIIADVYKKKLYLQDFLIESDLKVFNAIIDKTADRADYERSIKNLSQWLEEYHHKKTIILVDEYDIPIQHGYLMGFYNQVVSLIRSVLSSSLKGNDSLKMGVMTGVLRVSKESIFSDLNNPKIYDMMSPAYNEAFGFTEKETKELLEYCGLELTNDVKNMYDGYNFSGASIYNPWSVLNYAEDHILQPYWMNTSGNVLIKKMLGEISENDKMVIEKLLQKESTSFGYDNRTTYQDFEETTDLTKVLNLLFASGYLTYDKQVIDDLTENTYHYFKIPNEEVRYDLTKMVQSITFQKELLETNEYKDFIRNLLLGEKEEVEKYFNKLLLGISFYDTKESFYHGYMIGLLGGFLNSRFTIKSNRETGSGRADVFLEKNDHSVGCVFEFKIAESESEMESLANTAKEQMKEKEYYKELELDKVQNIKEYAVVFCGKKCIVR